MSRGDMIYRFPNTNNYMYTNVYSESVLSQIMNYAAVSVLATIVSRIVEQQEQHIYVAIKGQSKFNQDTI